METKLKSVLKNPTLLLAFKAGLFGVFLFLVGVAQFKISAVLIFLVVALLIYTRPLFRTFEFLTPLIILLTVSLMGVVLSSNTIYFFPVIAFFSYLFFLILGLKDLALIRRADWHRFLNLSLAYSVFLLFFNYTQEFFLPRLLLLFLATLFLLGDLLKKRIFYWLLALLIIEAAWAIGLLPIGFISAATLLLLVYSALTDVAVHYLGGNLPRRRILANTSIFVLLLLLIFAFARWSL